MTHFQTILVASGLSVATQLEMMPSIAGEPGAMPGDEAMTCQRSKAREAEAGDNGDRGVCGRYGLLPRSDGAVGQGLRAVRNGAATEYVEPRPG